MSGRIRLSEELAAEGVTDIALLRRKRGLAKEKKRRFEAGPYARHLPPPEWGLKLRGLQIFAVLAAEGVVTTSRLIAAVYGESAETVPSNDAIRGHISLLRKKLAPFGVEIRSTSEGWRFLDLPKVYELARITGEPPAHFAMDTVATTEEEVQVQVSPERRAAQSQDPLVYTIAEAADAVRVSRTFILKEVKDGRLVARQLGRQTVILKDDLLAYLRGAPRSGGPD